MPSYAESKEATVQAKLIEVPTSVSDDYCEFMTSGFAATPRNRLKAIGQFLTPGVIADSMIRDCIEVTHLENKETLRIIDPFCGDARLLTSFLVALAATDKRPDKVDVVAWDIDSQIIEAADKAISEISAELPFEVNAQVVQKDAFNCDTSMFATFDVCVTNPPWSSTKSLKASAFESKSEYDRYQSAANAYGKLLVERFPEVKGGRSFGAGALNLSRFGIALSLRMLKATGVCAIVMPSSFTADTSSSTLRQSMFQHFNLHSLHYYPAELKLFTGADQAAVYMVMSASNDKVPGSVVSHLRDRVASYRLDMPFWDYAAQYGWLIPLGYCEDEIKLIEKMSQFPTLGAFKTISLGREVDETRISERLCESSPYRFVKGFMITCYKLSSSELWYYDPEKAPVPPSTEKEKVVWRDVSRVSQRKRVQATLLEPKHVAGNSLGVATCDNPRLLRALLGIMNSSVFEFMARTVLTTNHVSSGMLKRLPFPDMSDETVDCLAAGVDEVLSNPYNASALEQVDIMAADAYGLTAEEFDIAKRAIKADYQLSLDI